MKQFTVTFFSVVFATLVIVRMPSTADEVVLTGQYSDDAVRAGMKDAQRWLSSDDPDAHFIIPIYDNPAAQLARQAEEVAAKARAEETAPVSP